MASFAPGKITRTVVIDWYNWKMRFEQIDHVDGALSETREIDVPADWYVSLLIAKARRKITHWRFNLFRLFAMKVVSWPGPDAKIPELKVTHDLYAHVVSRRKEKAELVPLKEKVSELLEELKEDAMLRLI